MDKVSAEAEPQEDEEERKEEELLGKDMELENIKANLEQRGGFLSRILEPFRSKDKMISLEALSSSRLRTNYIEVYRLYRQRLPYLIEDYLGINMNYYTSTQIPNNLIVSKPPLIHLYVQTLPERRMLKNNEIDDLKKLLFKGMIEIDDPIDSYSKHALIHDAIVLDREAFFDFLLAQGANLMLRDANGYTPLLKAAALGRTRMVHRLIEAGVDPRHTDPYGNTPRDKAALYNRYELVRYLREMEERANRGELRTVDWRAPERVRRSGRFLTPFDY